MIILEKLNHVLNQILLCLGGVILVGMIGLTCANILWRNLWFPIQGTFELMGYAGAVITAFALGHTQMRRGHIAVDVLINTFSAPVQRILHGINCLICWLFFTLVCWQVGVKAVTLMRTGEVTETLRIIYYPFTFAVALGNGVLALVLFIDLIRTFIPKRKENQ